MVFDGIVALFGERVLAFDADAAHHLRGAGHQARAAGACQWRTVILPPSPPPGYAVATRDAAPFQAAGIAVINPGTRLASIRDRTNIVTETAFSLPAPGPALLQNLESLGFTRMTPIQAQSLPLILEGRDLIAQAKTGSGKTAAFGLGLLQKINPPWLAPQCLVLCPTRASWPTRWRRNCAGWRARSPTSRC